MPTTEQKEIKLALTINGEEFVAPPPKMKMLKRVMAFNMRYQDGEIDLNTVDGVDAFFQLIVDIIGNDNLTVEKLEDLNTPLDQGEVARIKAATDTRVKLLDKYLPSLKATELTGADGKDLLPALIKHVYE